MQRISVDPKKVIAEASQLSAGGCRINDLFIEAYQACTEMQNDWHGPRYDELCGEFSKPEVLQAIDNMDRFLVETCPNNLCAIARNYATVLGLPVSGGDIGTIKPCPAIPCSGKDDIMIEVSKVTACQDKVKRCLNDVQNSLNGEITATFNRVKSNWDGDAAARFTAEFDKAKSDIEQACTTLNTSFEEKLGQAVEDAKAVEQRNTVV